MRWGFSAARSNEALAPQLVEQLITLWPSAETATCIDVTSITDMNNTASPSRRKLLGVFQ